jgi:hypothetical protein
MGHKNGLERRVWQFYTICDKNQLLKVKIGKVMLMAILVPRWLDFSWQVRLRMCLKFCMVKVTIVWGAQTNNTISNTSEPRGAAKAGNWARTDSLKNILHHGSEELCGSGDIVLYAWAPHTICDFHHTKFKTHLQPDLPAEIQPSGYYNCHNFPNFYF